MQYELRNRVWLYPGKAGWRFVTLSKKVGKDIRDVFGVSERGFGSLPVKVTVGKTRWKTSIFPDKKSGSYLLPIKAEVRKKENIADDAMLSYIIEIQL